jgi:hypothetical protein
MRGDGKLGVWLGPMGMAALLLCGLGMPGTAQETADPAAAEAEAEGGVELSFGIEAKAHFRDSDENRFRVPFPFTPPMLPPGETAGFEETVNPGSHFEVSVLTLLVDAVWSEGLAAHAKIDAIDLYDRNPTSGDRKIDVDEVWIRFGRETDPGLLPARGGAYLKVGKFGKFERQDDRHLESYGLLSTAFNRFEDTGVELGLDLGRHLYLKAAATQGNPLFLRDPNALAGDNGLEETLGAENPDPELGTGIVILYDAEVEDLDADGDPELGAGLGLRFGDDAGRNAVDLLVWGYRRRLAETVELEGTFYGGDLDLLRGPFDDPRFSFPGLRGDDKQEVGANLWVYLGGFSFFGQFVDQEIANLPRTGWEGELAWRFDLPLVWAVAGRQLFPAIAPAVRYSRLDNDFRNPALTPAPSLNWDWEKLDAGLRFGILEGIDLTVEYAANRFILGSGAEAENDELLSTLRWRM